MSDPLAGELGRDQLRELITILGELRNAGPRDQRFKQWRQVTVTLLQRMWAGQPERAERFRRIPFSAPTMLADRKATREYFERGCSEAIGYLESLLQELTPSRPAPPRSHLKLPQPYRPESPAPVNPSERPAAVAEPPARQDPVPTPAAHTAPQPIRHEPPVPAAHAGPPTTPEAHEPHVLEEPEGERPPAGPRPRLKDMLGFGEEATHVAPTTSRAVPSTPAQATPPPIPTPPAPERPESHGTGTKPAIPVLPARVPVGDDEESDASEQLFSELIPPERPQEARRDLAAEFVLESTVLQSRARPLTRTESPPSAVAPKGALEVMSVAAELEELGVPMRHRAALRAALADLSRQMESPPVYWDSMRQSICLAMDHPDLARRVLPLLLPYLDQAA